MSEPLAKRASSALAASYDAVNEARLTARATINETITAPLPIAHGRRLTLSRYRLGKGRPSALVDRGRLRARAVPKTRAASRLPVIQTATGRTSRARFSSTDRPK